jgi:hypothetical protein
MRTALGEIPDRFVRDMSMADMHEYLQARRHRPNRRTFLRGVAATGALAVAGPTLWRRSALADGQGPTGIHLAQGPDAARSRVISWSGPAGAAAEMRYGTSAQGMSNVATIVERTVDGVPDRVYHHAELDGLAPSSTYRYEIRLAGGPSRSGSFTTAPATANPFRFAAVGDMGAGDAGTAVTRRISAAHPDLVLFVGDLCYADRTGSGDLNGLAPIPGIQQDLSTWDRWLDQIEPSAGTTPWMFTTGNHEMEAGQGPRGYDGFLARMHVPQTRPGAPYYWFRHQNVAFVALDANDVTYQIRYNAGYTQGAQDRWLADVLPWLRADRTIDFIVVGFHFCMYCTNGFHGSDGGPRDRWGGLFDEHGVDLVVNGHNHSYERTHPTRGGEPSRDDAGWVGGEGSLIRPAQDGTVYVTAGGGGQAVYPASIHPVGTVWTPEGLRAPEPAPWSAVRYAGSHSLLVADVEPRRGSRPATLRAHALSTASASDGSPLVIDRFTLER